MTRKSSTTLDPAGVRASWMPMKRMPSSLICRLRIAARPAEPCERTPSCSSFIVHTLKDAI
eukprot:10106934-Heterocapsa_arctica.AAC.1